MTACASLVTRVSCSLISRSYSSLTAWIALYLCISSCLSRCLTSCSLCATCLLLLSSIFCTSNSSLMIVSFSYRDFFAFCLNRESVTRSLRARSSPMSRVKRFRAFSEILIVSIESFKERSFLRSMRRSSKLKVSKVSFCCKSLVT
jgi:hypothetical protein